MASNRKLPCWLTPANRVVVALHLQRLGLAVGTMHLISVAGRKSGKLLTTPVSSLTVGGWRYIVVGLDQGDWVNVWAVVWGGLALGRKEERVGLGRAATRGAWAHPAAVSTQGATGVQFFQPLYGVSNDPEEFATLAPWCPVFRVEV